MIMQILSAIFDKMKRTWRNDPVAFSVGLAMVFAIWFWIIPFAPIVVIAYFVVIGIMERTGEKAGLEHAFSRAVTNVLNKGEAEGGIQVGTSISTDVSVPADKLDAAVPVAPSDKPVDNKPVEQPVSKPVMQPVKKTPKAIQFVGDFLSSEDQKAKEGLNIAEIETQVKAKIKGQDIAIEGVVNTLKRAAAGIRIKAESPLCVFLFLGPTGTGKTEIVKQIAAVTGRYLARFDMPNYSSEAGTWELIGSPPGYVGSNKPGRLTGDIRNNPNAILLLDEIEKANPKIWDPFLRVLDEGKLKDQSQGFTADFKNVMIFLTSNLLQNEDFIEDEKDLRNKILNEAYFRPELLNRIDRIVMFKQFDGAVMRDIVLNMLQRFVSRFLMTNKLQDCEVAIDRAVVEQVLSNIDLKFGVRDAERYVDKNLGDALAEAFLTTKGQSIKSLKIIVADNTIKAERR